MDKRTDINRAPEPYTTRDYIGMEATAGDPRAVTEYPLDDNTAPEDEDVLYRSTYAARGAPDRSRSTYRGDGRQGQRSAADIERDIEQTRAEMSSTIDEIEERLSPRHIRRQIRNSVNDTIDTVQDRFSPSNLTHAARGAGRNMFESIKENPIPAILTGIGLAWWARTASDQGGNDFRTRYASRYPVRGRSRRYDGSYRSDYYSDEDYYRTGEPMYYGEPGAYPSRRYDRESDEYGRAYGERSRMDRAREKAGEMADQAENVADDLKARAGRTMHEVEDRASEYAGEAQYQMRNAAHRVEYGTRRATSWLEDMMHERPMACGAVALGIGAMIGMALPETRREDELMGRTRDRFVDEMEDTASEYAQKAEHVAERATKEIKQSVKDVASASKEEAKKQGLTGSGQGSSSQGSGSSSSGSPSSGSGDTSRREDNYSGTKPGSSVTGQIGGTDGASGLENAKSGVGPAADRNKGGSNI